MVYLLVPLDLSYGREVIRGVREYTRANRLWQLVVVPATLANLRAARREKADGIIGLLGTRPLEQAARATKIPAVNATGKGSGGRLPSVGPDDLAIGRIAAEHFLQRGFRQFAFAAARDDHSAHARRQGFGETLAAAGFGCEVFAEGHDARWIRALPKPAGVLACNDVRARDLVVAALRAGLRVPQDLSVVGVGNDETLCELAEVPLSSIDPDARRIGFEAAQMLDRLIAGKSVDSAGDVVPPAGLVLRDSSDSLAVGDDQLANAMRYMQAHACDPMKVTDMLDVVKVSRRTLEKRFRTTFGRTLHDEIRRLQFERARQLLCDTDLKIPQVATRCGFRDPKRFTTLFREEFGSPPITFRRDAREVTP